jgi:hypothetical protein
LRRWLFSLPLAFTLLSPLAASGGAGPDVTIASATTNRMGFGFVGVELENHTAREVTVSIEARPRANTKAYSSATIEPRGRTRAAVEVDWPKACSSTPTEATFVLKGDGFTVDDVPRKVRVTPGTCTVKRTFLTDPISLDRLSPGAIAETQGGRLYYLHAKVLQAPKTCGDTFVTEAEIVNATSQTLHHARLRIPQAGLVPDEGVTLAPGARKVVRRSAIWEGTGSVPIFVEASLDEAGTSPAPREQLMARFTSGVAFQSECTSTVTLTPVP